MKNKIIFKTLMLKGEAGSTIVSMEKTGHVGTADIYTITFNDGSTTEISLENMSAITSVEKTSSTDTEDIYTITCADGSTQTFSVLNHNADIAAMSDDIDTIDARVDNFINSVVPNTVETLWTGSIQEVGDSATLSKAVSNFDYIDLYLLGSADSKYIRVPATQTAVDIHQQNLSDDASSNFLRLWEMGVSISGSTVSITKSIAWAWDDPDNSNPTVTANAQNGVPITRIDGVKVASNTPAELVDIRVGSDGKTYDSAGAAVRGQNNEKLNIYTDCPFSINNYRINPTDGKASYVSNQNITDFIPCKEGQVVSVHARTTWYQGNSLNACIAFYDSLKQLIIAYDKFSDSESSNTTGTMTKTAPANAAYFRSGSQIITDQYARFYNIEDNLKTYDESAKLSEINSDVLQVVKGTVLITANTNHSSTADQIPVNIPLGTRFVVYVNGAIASAQIYAYYSDGTYERLIIGKYYNGKSTKAISNIGIYVAAADASITENIDVSVYTEKGIYGCVKQRIPYKESLSQTVCNILPADIGQYGVNSSYASKMYTAIQDWMSYCAGNYKMVPFIVHTDQHGALTDAKKGIFDLLSVITMWDNVSAIFNLGDSVVDHWEDDDTFTDPLLLNETLEMSSRCLSSIPKEKQINVYGNHDTWYQGYVETDVSGVLPSLNYLNPYFRPCGLRTKPLVDNSGFQVVYDDMFNVKYLVIGCWDYADKTGDYTGYQWYWINQTHLDYLVSEMEKNDGYDLILISHVPLEMGGNGSIDPTTGNAYTLNPTIFITHYDPYLLPLWNARKNKTSGTITHEGLSLTYDFTNCENDCLCALAGHTHHDGAEYIDDSNDGLLQIAFDYFTDYTIHFGVIDRQNRKIKCWKISQSAATIVWDMPFEKE